MIVIDIGDPEWDIFNDYRVLTQEQTSKQPADGMRIATAPTCSDYQVCRVAAATSFTTVRLQAGATATRGDHHSDMDNVICLPKPISTSL